MTKTVEGRLGVVSDIHGNSAALRAVLDDGAALGVEVWLVLGDVVAMGADPGGVLGQLDEVDVLALISGNTERYVLTGDRPDPSFEDVIADPSELARLVEVVGSFSWTRGNLSGQGLLDPVTSWVPDHRIALSDGSRLLAVHASLVADDGVGIHPERVDADYRRLFPDVAADLVVGGHTHTVTDHMVDGVRFVNPGSVSNLMTADKAARYAVIDASPAATTVEFRSVQYDVARAVADIEQSGIPGAGFLVRHYFS